MAVQRRQLAEVLLDLRGVAAGQAAADVARRGARGSSGSRVGGVLGVLGEEGLAQALAGAVGQGGDASWRVMPEQRRDVGGLLALDLGVPQHQLPALGQRGERARRRGVLEALDGGVAERHARVERRQVVGGLQPRAGPEPVDVQTAYGGQQVGAEREVRARRRAAAPPAPWRTPRRPGRRTSGPGHQLAGQPAGGVHVPLEQLAVGLEVPARGPREISSASRGGASPARVLLTGVAARRVRTPI